MGDVLTLIDKASEAFDEKDLDKLANRSRNAELTLEDFLEQMQSMKKMGGIREMLKLLPGMSGHADQLEQVDDNALKKPEAIIRSMTPRSAAIPASSTPAAASASPRAAAPPCRTSTSSSTSLSRPRR